MPRMLPSTRSPDRRRAAAGEASRPARTVPNGAPSVDAAAVSSAASGASAHGSRGRTTPPATGTGIGHGLVAVGPGLAGSLLVTGGYGVNPFPVQPAKIHCPPDREDTLSRERLNSWLERAAGGRVGLIVAEAGFGKTTLLGDWARHTRRMTAWYRLEPDDRDWLTFVRHLVASGRELDPGFAPETFGLLLALGSGGPTVHDLTRSIAREMAELGTGSERGLTLILDDYHLIDGFEETEPIVRALVDRTGQGFSVVIASRSTPSLALGRVRARGGVMTLGARDLRFDVAETSTLFRDAYRHPLDEDVLSDLCTRTDGWVALLSLVRTGLADNGDARQLVAHLAASRGDIYDFLAEEVLAALPEDLVRFLARASVLIAVDPVAAAIADQRTPDEARAAIAQAERLGLLSRPDRESPHRFHPLVREFLSARLTTDIGDDAVRRLHRRLADELPAAGWNIRAWHLLKAGDRDACQAVVDGALEQIIAAGDFDVAKQFLGWDAGDPNRPEALLLRSRIELSRGDFDRGMHWARLTVQHVSGGPLLGLSLLNLAFALSTAGIADEAASYIMEALAHDLSPVQRYIAQANLALLQASQEGDLRDTADSLRALAADQERTGQRRYAGISRLNLAGVLLWVGDASEALREGALAEDLLGGRGRETIERLSATMIAAVAKAQLGNLTEAREAVANATDAASSLGVAEVGFETTRMEVEFGSWERAEAALQQVKTTEYVGTHEGLYCVLAGELALRRADLLAARAACDRLRRNRCADAAGKLREQLLATRLALREGSEAGPAADEARRLALAQNTPRGRYLADLLTVFALGASPEAVIAGADDTESYCWSLLAEEVSERLHHLSPPTLRRIAAEARLRPERWASALRLAIETPTHSSQLAAGILAEIGSQSDASWLRRVATTRKALRPPALALTKRLAEPVFIRDLGVVEVVVGTDATPRVLRRKVLALLCYLSSRPGMAASREETIEALWPDLAPDAGSNSMHQAIYSLRRAFEPDFREGLSAGYIQFDGDVVTLNRDLVDTTSRRCWRLLRQMRAGVESAFAELEELYTSRYALTFAYDDWAETYRENLHAAVLAAAESSLVAAMRDSDFERAIQISHTMLAVDPHADGIELELLRAYKRSGRHAAAAEQYAHYAAYVRQELAADPPSYDEI